MNKLKYQRDYASKEEVLEYTKEKVRELYNKLFTVYERAVSERYTPINNRYMNSHSSECLSLEKAISSFKEKMDYLTNKYLAQDVKN